MAEWVLHVQDIEKSFGRHQVLRGVSFDVAPGTLVDIVGENGAGKSTLLNILARVLRPNRGQVVVRRTPGYCPQQMLLHDGLTLNQHLDYFRVAYGIRIFDRAGSGELRWHERDSRCFLLGMIASLGYNKCTERWSVRRSATSEEKQRWRHECSLSHPRPVGWYGCSTQGLSFARKRTQQEELWNRFAC